jgi:DNA-binding LytR/AlgR family response regulator
MTKLYTENGEYETTYTLKYWLEELKSADFVLVHKSYLVSLRYIPKIEDDSIVLQGIESKIPLSRRNSGLVNQSFLEYMKLCK